MGKVPIWAQWSIIGAGALLSPLLVLLAASAVGWLLLQKLWLRPRTKTPVEPHVRPV
jgi:hypothetical protein